MEPVEEQLAHISLKDEDTSSASKIRDDSPKNESEKSNVSDSADRDEFMALVRKARECTEAGNIMRALKLNRRALAIHYSEKLEKRIKKMEAFLDDEDDYDDRKDMETLGQGFLLHKSMSQKLYAHQKDGVLWLWSLFLKGKGGVLADDMGLGKTIQIIAFLSGLFDMGKVKSVLIVLPLSLIPVWLKEFTKWTPGINVMQYHGDSRKEKERSLNHVRSRGGVMLTTYGLIVTQQEKLSIRHGREFVWDYVILDEGHKIKNPTKTSKSIHRISAKMRIILTGTPVQNNLKELWALFDYVHQGALLGTLRTFKMEFDTPITRARERDASAVEKRLGEEMAETLKSIIQPYFLRRTKADVKAVEGQEVSEDTVQMPSMTRKNDLVIWLFLSDVQKKIYEDFINLDDIKALLNTKKSPLVALTVLKKICDHPRLLSTRACLKLGLDGEDFDEEDLERESSYESAANQIDKIADDVLIEEAGKMKILMDLLDTFKREGHKTLVFSQSRKLLDIIDKVLKNRGYKVARLDGTISQTSEREAIVADFQKDETCCVFLLTIQVGGVGLTITSADRVIIYDPSWNPAVDAQAVDRAYRIGQEKNVVVYRLITCGTVEEKIYRRQVFKDSITQQTTGSSKNPYRYFTKMELRELFALDDPYFSKTQRQLQDMHADQRITDPDLDSHLAFLHSLDIFGISDHDLMFKKTDIRDDEIDDDCEFVGVSDPNRDVNFIQHRIQQAQNLIAQESSHQFTYEQRNKGTRTFQPAVNDLRLPVGLPNPRLHERENVPPTLDSDEASSGTRTFQPAVNDLRLPVGAPSPRLHERENVPPTLDSDEASSGTRTFQPAVNDLRLPVGAPSPRLHERENVPPTLDSDEASSGTRTFQPAFNDLRLPVGAPSPRLHERENVPPTLDSDEAPSDPLVTDLTISDDEGPAIKVETVEDEDGDDVVIVESPPRQKMPSQEKERRALQPLSPEEVKHRSPQVVSPVKQGGPIVPEHLIISPDGRKPVMGLAQDSAHPKYPFSPGRRDPMQSPREDKDHHILVADSPDSSDSRQSSLSPSSACRRLSFVVPNSEENSLNHSLAASVDDEENSDNESDEELFQDLVSIGRSLYKSKQYEQSLEYVEKALAIYQEPGLQEMAEKIKMRIASALDSDLTTEGQEVNSLCDKKSPIGIEEN